MKQITRLGALIILSCIASACGPRVTDLPTASDFCLLDTRIVVNPHPNAKPEQADPDNKYDTDETVLQALAHNEVRDRVCGPEG